MTHLIFPKIIFFFFVLIGVRISAFVSSNDKKPQQKSIAGFLQTGKTDLRGSSKEMPQELNEKDHLSQTWPSACLSNGQTHQRPEEVSAWRQQSRSEGKKTGGEPQMSFFQRAHAKRLQLQAMNENTQEANDSVISSSGTCAQNGVESSTEAHKGNCTASEQSDNDCIPLIEAHASRSGCDDTESDSLSCPVCFRKVDTTDLNIFNRHIDQCLSDSCRKSNQSTVSDSKSDLDIENNHKDCEDVVKVRRVEDQKAKKSEELESNSDEPAEVRHSLTNSSTETALLINDNNKAVMSQQPQACYDKGPVLICPICQHTQDNDDLIIFNHHVDLCLNQEALHELGGQTAFTINLPSAPNKKVLGECVHQIRSSIVGQQKLVV